MSLENWRRNGWLRPHKSSKEEIRNLLTIADRDLRVSKTKDLIADWRLEIAYNAALQTAVAVLAAAGYKAERGRGHHHTIQALEFTLGNDQLAALGKLSKKRHQSNYEVAGAVSDGEAAEMLKLAENLRFKAEEWIRRNRPDLV